MQLDFYSVCLVSFESLPILVLPYSIHFLFFFQIFAELYIVVNQQKHTATHGRSKYFLFSFLFIIFSPSFYSFHYSYRESG